MRGNLGYYAGIDRKNNAMSNVSLWKSVEAAEQMATFQPMIDLASTFAPLGVRMQRPILNFTTLWGASLNEGECDRTTSSTSASGPWCHFAAMRQLRRFGSEADIEAYGLAKAVSVRKGRVLETLLTLLSHRLWLITTKVREFLWAMK